MKEKHQHMQAHNKIHDVQNLKDLKANNYLFQAINCSIL
jgi:hypothetical protein